jgi:hypothetical protein
MLISQLLKSNPSLDADGFDLLQRWYKKTNQQKQKIMTDLAEDIRNRKPATQILNHLKQNLKKK